MLAKFVNIFWSQPYSSVVIVNPASTNDELNLINCSRGRPKLMTVDEICSQLTASPQSWDAPITPGIGLYSVFVHEQIKLPRINLGSIRVIYVGMTKDCFTKRDHFRHAHSGTSSPRRTLGALLKDQLSLVPQARGGENDRNRFRNYRFSDENELSLSKWMSQALLINRLQLAVDVRSIEKKVIASLEPPLNLTDWPNPQRAAIKQLRSICAEEAKLTACPVA